jgi:hypothetical protein
MLRASPSSIKNAKSCASLITVEKDVLTRVFSASSAIVINLFHITSRAIASKVIARASLVAFSSGQSAGGRADDTAGRGKASATDQCTNST